MSSSPSSGATRRGLSPRALTTFGITGVLITALNLRIAVATFPPAVQLINRDFAVGTEVIGVFGTLPVVIFGISAFVGPALSRGLGLISTLTLAMACGAVGQVVRVLPGVGMLGLFLGSILALFGLGLGNALVPVAVRRFGPGRIPLLTTLYGMALQVGMGVSAALVVPISERSSWRWGMGIWAALAAVAVLAWIVVLVSDRRATPRRQALVSAVGAAGTAADGTEPALGERGATHPPVRPLWHLFRSSGAVGLAMMFGGTSFATYVSIAFLAPILTDAGATSGFAGLMLGYFGVLGIVSAFVAPWMCQRLNNPFGLAVVSVCLHGIGIFGLWLDAMAMPWLWVTALSVGTMTFNMSLTLLNLRSSAIEGAQKLSGFVQGVGYTYAAIGPLLGGWLHGATGSWTLTYVMIALDLGIILTGAWFACKPRFVDRVLFAEAPAALGSRG